MAENSKNKSRADITLKRTDIVKNVHNQTGLSSAESSDLVNSILDNISDALTNGNDVKLAGFGTFKISDKAERLGRNPKTNEEAVIKARRVVTFKPSNMIKKRINVALGKAKKNDAAKPSPQSIIARRIALPDPKFSQVQWAALFELLGLMCAQEGEKQEIMSDAKFASFVSSVMELKVVIDPKAPITKTSTQTWLRANKKKLDRLAKTDRSDTRLNRTLKLLAPAAFKHDILCFMVQVAIGDGDYNKRERRIIQKAILYWDIPATMSHDIDYICNDIITDIRETNFADRKQDTV